MAAALAQGRLAADLLLWRTRAWTLLHHGVDLSPQSVKTASKSGERALQGAKNLTQDVVRTPNSAKNASQSVKRTPQSAWTAPRGVGITLRCSTGLQKMPSSAMGLSASRGHACSQTFLPSGAFVILKQLIAPRTSRPIEDYVTHDITRALPASSTR
jgi:hypothetical protein